MTPNHVPPAGPSQRQAAMAPLRRCTVLLSIVLLAIGCGDEGDYPRGWAALRAPAKVSGVPADTPATRTCPEISGLYRVNDSIIFRHLMGRKLSFEQRQIPWYTVDISGSTADSLRGVLTSGIVQDTVWIARGRDFDCNSGWITSKWPEYVLRMWPPDSEETSRGYESTLAIARDVQGRLIGRMTTVSYREFSVWCGDGCRYAKIPFTRKDYVRWHRMSTDRTGDPDGGEEMLDSVSNAKIAREEAALEAGTPLPRNAMQTRMMEQERRIETGAPPR